MRQITRTMYKKFKMKELGFDFMGYEFKRAEDLSFHHLIIPHRESRKYGIGDGYVFWNGAILVQETSHNYLHLIEWYDPDVFYDLTSEMIDENIKHRLDVENLRRIDDLLCYFEREHCSTRNSKGKLLIKEKYTNRRKF